MIYNQVLSRKLMYFYQFALAYVFYRVENSDDTDSSWVPNYELKLCLFFFFPNELQLLPRNALFGTQDSRYIYIYMNLSKVHMNQTSRKY